MELGVGAFPSLDFVDNLRCGRDIHSVFCEMVK